MEIDRHSRKRVTRPWELVDEEDEEDQGDVTVASTDPAATARLNSGVEGQGEDVVESGLFVTPSPATGADLICLGMLQQLSCRPLPSIYATTQDQWKSAVLNDKLLKLALEYKPDRCLVSLPGRGPVVVLNNSVGRTLIELREGHGLHALPYVDHGKLSVAIRDRSTKVDICMNVYARESDLEHVGTILSDHELFLQSPDWEDPESRYRNPQVYTFSNLPEEDTWLDELGYSNSSDRVEENTDWAVVLDHLPQHRTLSISVDPTLIDVELMKHQLEGLDFMLRREIGQLDEGLRYWHLAASDQGVPVFKHVVTKDEVDGEPAEPPSGILADDMGLGKTLTTLALIANSKARAADFAIQLHDTLIHTKATLVVLPSMLILDGWIKELEEKLRPDLLKYATYHGQERARHHEELLGYDIVFTTYGTIAKEFRRMKARDMLYRMSWFPHVIRSQRTRQFMAITTLHANHHWCLTGTPISNKVEDLGALIRFCRVPQLEEPSTFREHIVKPTKRSFRAGCAAVQKTLWPLCLRRTKQLLNLPEPTLLQHVVELSEKERHSYERMMAHCKQSLNLAVSGRDISKKKQTMLQTILKLRIFCNHGTFMPSLNEAEDDNRDPDEELALLQQSDSSHCSQCQREIFVLNQSQVEGTAILTLCDHVLCQDCHEGVRQAHLASFTCPVCDSVTSEKPLESWYQHRRHPQQETSSKLMRLATDLQQSQGQEKSLVLSCWKKTTDLASTLCAQRGITHVRIDGTVPQAERRTALEKFISDPDVSCLLMTMGTGALGLNLTVATRIHILEPQWNPTVEQQAIGRSIRIGQERNTTVVRYLVKNTIEEQIQVYQRRKLQLAAGGFGDASASVEVQAQLLTATFFREHRSQV